MRNQLKQPVIERIAELAARGLSMREVARQVGISTNTCKQYYSPSFCGCGKLASHNGWCGHRYALSAARQNYQASRSGKKVDVGERVRTRRLDDALGRGLHYRLFSEDKEPFTQQPLSEWFGALRWAQSAARKVAYLNRLRSDVAEEITNELAAALMEGRIGLHEVWSAAKAIYKHRIQQRAVEIPLEAPLRRQGNRTLYDLIANLPAEQP